MEESKELQGFYKIFRAVVYVSVLLEFFEYAIDPAVFDQWGGILTDIHGRIKRWTIYQDGHLVYSKIATILLICITCIGTRNKKHLEFNARKQVIFPLTGGLLLLVLSVWLFGHPMEMRLYTLPLNRILYMAASLVGVILVHIALDNISKFIKEGLMKDRFNFENESFEQSEEIQENKYSVNIPMRYYYKGKFRKGWVSISNPFRGTWVVGTPGSGKTFSIIEPFIRQHSAKGFAMVVYDYKFPTLATKLYYHYKLNEKLGRVPKGCKFNMINFVDVEYSRRVNPIQAKYINNLAAASETAETLLESLQKGKKEGGGGSDQFFQTSAVNFLAACIYFFVNYEREPYDKDGNMLYAEKRQDPETKFWKPTGVVRDKEGGNIVEPAYWLGKYSDMPHILSFLNESYQTIFEVLETDNEVAPLLGPFQTAFRNKAMEQLEGMIGTLRVYTSRLATKESYWIFHRDGDDFDLKVSDPKNPSLADLKGKYIYIDVWATWCGPCRGELPALKELEEKYAGKDIHFVSLSCDKNKKAWENMVTKDQLKGIQLHMGTDRTFMDAYLINGIPRFILLDRDGKIISANMTRPSDPKTAEKFNELLGL